MKIVVEHGSYEENEIVLRCARLDNEMLEVLSMLKAREQKLGAWKESPDDLQFLTPTEVLYAEAVEDKTFLYTEETTYRSPLGLAELEARYETAGFCRIHKSTVVNLHSIESLKSCTGRRILAGLRGGERLMETLCTAAAAAAGTLGGHDHERFFKGNALGHGAEI